jgi:hypothetical protein
VIADFCIACGNERDLSPIPYAMLEAGNALQISKMRAEEEIIEARYT